MTPTQEVIDQNLARAPAPAHIAAQKIFRNERAMHELYGQDVEKVYMGVRTRVCIIRYSIDSQ